MKYLRICILYLVVHIFSCRNVYMIYCVWCYFFGPYQVFDKNILICFFYHNSFYIRVRQRIQKFILHQILYFYPRINFMNKGMFIFRKFICDVTHHKPFGLGLTDFNEVCRNIVYIIKNIITFFYRRFYNIICMILILIILIYFNILVYFNISVYFNILFYSHILVLYRYFYRIYK